ncbi:MAG TPA: T9SS type A sorting domain-containing protein [Candidatus Krumholzibacteria bacterium]|nr:T9SS type A sorting domain-containing protein [Candidatus Krumholzibacteria bacterium]HPD72970.1 T9SS type A sorting domain-containing protein [Candidatus Krumholzibacteria bacterium]HRY41769.1 T9SS type A sorting domain-containing protein [Candidatus Krumholzibacteria bacterium]
MRFMFIAVVCLACAGAIRAQDDPTCQGGDGLLDATVIASLPFFAEGTTTGYADDFDAWCKSGDELAPDVVYVYTPEQDGEITIDLCGSNFNTVVYVLDAEGSYHRCNDDRLDQGTCSSWTSRLDRVPVAAGLEHFIVVDGAYASSHGFYDLTVVDYEPYEFQPPWYAETEDEPPLVDGYVDTYNGGCDAEDPEFQHHPFDPAFAYNASLHGRSGWYGDGAGGTLRDSDWYWVSIYAQGELNLTIEATETCRVYWYEVGYSCDELVLGGSMAVSPGYVNEMVIQGPYASYIRVAVRPYNPTPPDGTHHEFEYLLGVRYDGGRERPFPTPLGDQCLDAPVISHTRNRLSAPMSEFGDDHAPHGVCVDSASVDNDGLAQIYLYEGQRIQVGFTDIWYPEPAAGGFRAIDICFYLVTDARLTPGSCVDAHCGVYSEYGFGHTYTAPQSAWYYLICDLQDPYSWAGANVTFPPGSSYLAPPPPPPGDGCDTAPLIAHGPFSFSGDLADATNQLDPGRDGCLDDPDVHWTGGDVVYRVDFAAGDRLTADLDAVGDWDAALYLVSDCEEPMGACVASGLHLQHTALEDQSLWLVVDSWGIGPRAFTLNGSLDSVTAAPEASLAPGLTSIQPNPCNPSTTVEYALSRPSPVTLAVFDLRGRLVRTLVDADRPAGPHEVRWNGDDIRGRQVSSGVYIVRLETNDTVQTRSLSILR